MFPWPKDTSELAGYGYLRPGYVYPGWIRVEGPRTRITYLYASQRDSRLHADSTKGGCTYGFVFLVLYSLYYYVMHFQNVRA